MAKTRIDLYAIVLGSLLVLGAGCQAPPTSPRQEYRGTVYYADDEGVRKVKLPSQEVTVLSNSRPSFPTSLSLSPDEQWLAYTDEEWTSLGTPSVKLWVLSTQGGSPSQVTSSLVLGHAYWLNSSQLLYRDEQDTFIFDPRTRTRRLARDWTPRDGCFMWLNPSGKENRLEACRPGGDSRGYLRIVNLDGSSPITLTEPYGVNDSAQWSSNGESILFTDGPLDYEKIFMWDQSDGKLRQLIGQVSQRSYTFGDISGSPNGQWIVFDTDPNSLCVVEVSSGDVKCFEGFVSAFGNKVAWSPDSNAILISSNRIGKLAMGDADLQWDLFIVGIPNGNITQITHQSDSQRRYVWGR